MPLITLTSDWQRDDYYAAAFKGQVLRAAPEARFLDVSHSIRAFAFDQAAFVLRAAYRHCPLGAIHVLAVNSERGPDQEHLACFYRGYYFIGTDNGQFGLIFEEEPEVVVAIERFEAERQRLPSFQGLAVLARAAAHLAAGGELEDLGARREKVRRLTRLMPRHNGNAIMGQVLHVDSFQNAVSNITRELFERVREGRKFSIFVKSFRNRVSRINEYYGQTTPGEILALFNSQDLLELAISFGDLAKLLGVEVGDTITIKFE